MATFTSRPEPKISLGFQSGYGDFTTASVKSRAKVLYGYFEIRCKPMNSRASSGFWFSDAQPDFWTEIDVFEIGGGAPHHEHSYHMNAHVIYTPEYKGTVEKHLTYHREWKAPLPPCERVSRLFN